MPGLDPLVRLTSTATPLPLDSVDTDVITPMHRIMDGTFVEHAFEALRINDDGGPKPNPFDDPVHAHDQILVAGANFGCGSSRETAVWAVKGMGYRVVAAASFGDIFYANAFKNAVLPIVLAEHDIAQLLGAADRLVPVTVDVELTTIAFESTTIPFDLSPLRRTALLEGLDDLDVALRMTDAISRFEQLDHARRPWIQSARR